MRLESRSALVAGAVLLGLVSLVAAHGDEAEEHVAVAATPTMGMAMDMATPMPTPFDPESLKTYFRHPEHVTAILAHSGLMVLSWVFLLPVAIALSVAQSRYQLVAQITFLIANSLGLLTGMVYSHSTPDLYPKNKHHPIGWIITWIATGWVVLSVLIQLGKLGQSGHKRKPSGQPITRAAMAMLRRFSDSSAHSERSWSGDSGQGTERNTASLASDSRANSLGSSSQSPTREFDIGDNDSENDDFEKQGFLQDATVDRFATDSGKTRWTGLARAVKGMTIVKVVLDKSLLLFGFVGLVSGGIVYGGIMNGQSVFNGLAHFIKGGIFFWYGFLCLGRWMGCFADFGWAWNRKPPAEIVGKWCARMPSAEFIESAVIAFYGISNVGLEHLANTDGVWAAIDLEHVSITLMFFGGGLLGMLIESATIRDLLQATIQNKRDEYAGTLAPEESFEQPEQWRFSMNPMPALIITLLGIMMGSHHQASMVSTMMHKQWGNLFAGFGMMRIATYAILYLRGPSSYLPQRPPTEIVSSFCLMAGGILFMLSNKDTVAALEYNELDAMFVFNVVMGFNAFIMAWGAVCMAIKGLAQKREAQRLRPTRSPA